MLPNSSQFPNPNPPRPVGQVKPNVGTINPVKPTPTNPAPPAPRVKKTTDPNFYKPMPKYGRSTMPMRPDIKTKNVPMPYNKNASKSVGALQ
jgi:hypothetical protein